MTVCYKEPTELPLTGEDFLKIREAKKKQEDIEFNLKFYNLMKKINAILISECEKNSIEVYNGLTLSKRMVDRIIEEYKDWDITYKSYGACGMGDMDSCTIIMTLKE